MADDSAQEKTEQPTTRRKTENREKGNVTSSQELMSAITLIVLCVTTAAMGPKFVQWSMIEMREGFSCNVSNIADSQIFLDFVAGKIISSFMIMAPFFMALAIAAISGSILIGGFNLSTKTLEWKFSELNPLKGIKSLVSMSSLVKLGFSVLKLVFVGVIVTFYIRGRIDELATYQWAATSQLLGIFSDLILGAVVRLCIGLLIIGLVDMLYQKFNRNKKMMMSKQEVKDERKHQETPPEVQKKIRQKQFEIAMQRMLQDVPKADVVLVNPTHVAIAVQYDSTTMLAPVVLAKGGDHLCEKIKEIARSHGVPIIRRPALARNIFGTVDLGHPIPDNLFAAVAEVLALIFRLRHAR
jgi:flagellar biosynthetic protein FlhB